MAQDTSGPLKHAPGWVIHQSGRSEETDGEPRKGVGPTEWLNLPSPPYFGGQPRSACRVPSARRRGCGAAPGAPWVPVVKICWSRCWKAHGEEEEGREV